jgi:hypothetical protein
MALTGHLSDLSLSELIEFFCNQRKTGLLKVLYPQGPGQFYLQQGSVVDARVGVLRGIDAVYFALTLPNAKFEFSGSVEATERTINQPWTQVVLEGLRRLDEGVVPTSGFSIDDEPPAATENQEPVEEDSFTELENLRVPSFLSFVSPEALGKRKALIGGAVALALIASVAVIGVPAGWYHRSKAVVASSEVSTTPAPQAAAPTVPEPAPAETSEPNNEAAVAAKRQHDKEKVKLREEKAAALLSKTPATSVPVAPVNVASGTSKPGPKKVSVTVTYDESGRVTQASGGDATAVRIARQKRFPAGKAGSTTVTIPIN